MGVGEYSLSGVSIREPWEVRVKGGDGIVKVEKGEI